MARADTIRHFGSAQCKQELSIEQERAVALLLTGQTDQEVADQVGVSRQTVCEWRNNHAAFIAELNLRRQELWGGQVERLRGLVAKAVDVLAEDVSCKNDVKRRQAAAVHILRSVGLYGADLKATGETTAEGVEREKQKRELLDGLGL